jgi:hypothetical protein
MTMNRRKRRKAGVDVPKGGWGAFEIRGMEWDGVAPWWCSWCGEDLDDGKQLAFLPIGTWFTSDGDRQLEGFYNVRFPDRDTRGLMLAAGGMRLPGLPAGALDQPGLIACGEACVRQLSQYLRKKET